MASDKNDASLQCLTFRLGEEVFGIDVVKAREVLDCITITQVPQMPKFMLGVINLRGSVVPVIDMRLKFGLPAQEKTLNSCILVVEVEFEGESLTIGALADSVQEVIELRPDQIEPPPRIGTRLKTEFIRGMGSLNDRFLILLDIDKVFSAEELTIAQESGEAAEAQAI
ncbi:MAG: chemotaxis protein CheW [Desulfuromonadales bacterium]|jgi:purine-binding chemotaxis protein CheW